MAFFSSEDHMPKIKYNGYRNQTSQKLPDSSAMPDVRELQKKTSLSEQLQNHRDKNHIPEILVGIIKDTTLVWCQDL